jgi:hypothetical protein
LVAAANVSRVFQPFGGFADDVVLVDGFAPLPEESGIG